MQKAAQRTVVPPPSARTPPRPQKLFLSLAVGLIAAITATVITAVIIAAIVVAIAVIKTIVVLAQALLALDKSINEVSDTRNSGNSRNDCTYNAKNIS